MGCYVFYVGGSGSKMLEASLHAAAAGVFNVTGAPVNTVIVDLDDAGGNLERAKILVDIYTAVRASIGGRKEKEGSTDIGFKTGFELYPLTSVEKEAMKGILAATDIGDDREIARALYTDYELGMSYERGFYGHPNVGAHFFASQLPNLGAEHSFTEVIDKIRQELVKGGRPRILLAGSIFGGTGASAIPSIAKYIRQLTDLAGHTVGGGAVIGAMLLLPYFATTKGDDNVIDYTQFEPKAKAALEYYAKEGVGYGDNKVFNAIYMVGSQDKVVYKYCTGGSGQNNAAHLVDFLGAEAVSHFLTTNPDGYQPKEQDGHWLFNLDLKQRNDEGKTLLGWDAFPEETVRGGFGRLLRTAFVLATSYGNPIVKDMSGKQSFFRGQDAATKLFFKKVKADNEREEAVRCFQDAGKYFTELVRWVTEVLATLPPAMVNSDSGAGYKVSEDMTVPSNELVNGVLLARLYQYYMALSDGKFDTQDTLSKDISQEDVKELIHGLPGEYTFEKINTSLVSHKMESTSGKACFEVFLANLLDACRVD